MNENRKIRILGIAGSLRTGSYNKAILKNAVKLAPSNAEITIFDIKDIPIFNQDFEKTPPDEVIKLKKAIKNSDAILFVTPEYNYSIPGVLKNAIDWASRPYGDNSWEDKPVGIMGAANGMVGTARAQYHLRQMFVFLNMHPLNKPEVMIPLVSEKIDKDGNLTDEKTKEKIKELIIALRDWTIRISNRN